MPVQWTIAMGPVTYSTQLGMCMQQSVLEGMQLGKAPTSEGGGLHTKCTDIHKTRNTIHIRTSRYVYVCMYILTLDSTNSPMKMLVG